MSQNEYIPDRWMLVKMNVQDPFFKVLGSWSGGYLSGDSYRLNSGVIDVKYENGNYIFFGASGSKYICHEESYGVNMYARAELEGVIAYHKGKVEPFDEKPDHDFIMNVGDVS